ncbi:MAG: hypothetical protein OXG43_06430 [Chloroflexi bacterium]|nr:hypothetical protein [Chloroflexota bacterium]
MNNISAVAILVSLAGNLGRLHAQTGGNSPTLARLGRAVLAYPKAALAIGSFFNWIRLLLLAPGEAPRLHYEVLWQVIGAFAPLHSRRRVVGGGAQELGAAGPQVFVVDT